MVVVDVVVHGLHEFSVVNDVAVVPEVVLEGHLLSDHRIVNIRRQHDYREGEDVGRIRCRILFEMREQIVVWALPSKFLGPVLEQSVNFLCFVWHPHQCEEDSTTCQIHQYCQLPEASHILSISEVQVIQKSSEQGRHIMFLDDGGLLGRQHLPNCLRNSARRTTSKLLWNAKFFARRW